MLRSRNTLMHACCEPPSQQPPACYQICRSERGTAGGASAAGLNKQSDIPVNHHQCNPQNHKATLCHSFLAKCTLGPVRNTRNPPPVVTLHHRCDRHRMRCCPSTAPQAEPCPSCIWCILQCAAITAGSLQRLQRNGIATGRLVAQARVTEGRSDSIMGGGMGKAG